MEDRKSRIVDVCDRQFGERNEPERNPGLEVFVRRWTKRGIVNEMGNGELKTDNSEPLARFISRTIVMSSQFPIPNFELAPCPEPEQMMLRTTGGGW